MNRFARTWLGVLLLAITADAAFAAETATLARDSELRSKALSDAPVVVMLKANSAVTISSRLGAWAKVTTSDRKSGYVRLLNLRTKSTVAGNSGVSALVSTFRTGSSGQSVATGVKGMSAEQLTDAQPAPEQVEKLAGFRDSDSSARSGAASSGLKAQQVAYLPAPVKEAGKGE